MRFMFLVKSREAMGPPPPALMEAITKSAEEATRAGELITTGGLALPAASTRVAVRDGKLITSDGPFTETKDVVGGFAIFELKSREEALERVTAFMDLHRKFWPGWQGETEIREIFTQGECASQQSELAAARAS
jgi:hypothetical protein